jgi:hypothetical protein
MDSALSDALIEGYRAIMEAQDAGMEKLEKYLNRKRDVDIKDADGYLTTSEKAYNYFDHARIVTGHWAVHFTKEEYYDKIKKSGFSHGTTVLDHLAYTSQYEGGRGKQGWLFALPVDTAYLKHYDMGYGDCAFLIKADGVIAKHEGERDVEMLFRDKDVIEKIPFRYEQDSGKWKVEIDGEKPRYFRTIGEIVDMYTD